jgi:hypothetical protein
MIFATAEPQHIIKPLSDEIEVEEKFLISDVDPLVLSCCQYRHNDPTAEDYDDIAAYAWVNGNLSYLYGKVTQADHDLANNIRTHFRGKILVSKICGNKMSKFRQDLATYLDIEWNPNVQISTIYRGMIYKLPYFYHNDLILANEIFTTKHQGITKPQTSWNRVTLTYIRSIEERKKKKTSINYWFKDQHGTRYKIPIEKTNPLIPIWEPLITANPVTIQGAYLEHAYDTLNFYYVPNGWKLVI